MSATDKCVYLSLFTNSAGFGVREVGGTIFFEDIFMLIWGDWFPLEFSDLTPASYNWEPTFIIDHLRDFLSVELLMLSLGDLSKIFDEFLLLSSLLSRSSCGGNVDSDSC